IIRMKCVLLFSQQHIDFRLAELRGICRAHDIDPTLLLNIVGVERAIYLVEMEFRVVSLLLNRSMLLKSAYEWIEQGENYEELQRRIEERNEYFKPYNTPDLSFAVRLRPVGRKKGVNALGRAREVGSRLPMADAPVNLENPDTAFTILEEYLHEKAPAPDRIFFCRLIGHGQFGLKNDFNLQDRIYIGNTTMDPELSFIQANISAVKSADVVIDPFCGTGGLLLPAAKFGALVMGSEINYQIAKAVGRSSRAGVDKRGADESTAANFEQYGLSHKLLCILMGDASRHDMWKDDEFVDVIVSDPPYGIREKGRKIGFKERKEHWTLPGSEHAQHFPEKQVYSLASVFCDLVDFAASRLRVGGRVSFWFPVIREEYSTDVLPAHPSMKLVENCEQTLTLKTSRRLLCYEKIRSPLTGESTMTVKDQYAEKTFRDVMYPENK
ncbi:hypothetical protein PFISCL1PPCAC_24665, partial [Pristionchus fissidentatus]